MSPIRGPETVILLTHMNVHRFNARTLGFRLAESGASVFPLSIENGIH